MELGLTSPPEKAVDNLLSFGIGVAAMKDPSRSSTSPSIISEDIEEELWEEEFIERCFQEMLEEEEEHEWFIPARDLPQTMDQIQDQFNDLVISDSSSLEDLVVKSNLNPNAKEFVPGIKRRSPTGAAALQDGQGEAGPSRSYCPAAEPPRCVGRASPS
ncbi:hypothetical protein DV515_00015372 [Chloebia gouldiae]|uniref:Polyadenylate-binding protein-interacting protein 2 n=1 Tax=Chloebia gouldiae TaxID=44316 RepID=A0A3L8RVM7_CHLGU|nr:hypothetical protein DV515_00015372 [Chloebia gouldiae]